MEGKIISRDFLLSLSEVLVSEYGFDVQIGSQPKSSKRPCFYIELIRTQQRKIGVRGYERKQAFCIHYDPEEQDDLTLACIEVGEHLLFLLEWLDVGKNKKRGSQMEYTIMDNALQFYLNFDYHFLVKDDEQVMETLEQTSGIKNGS